MEVKLPKHEVNSTVDVSFLLQYDEIASFIKGNNLSEEFVRKNYITFKRWADSLSLCKNCQSISSCRQEHSGYHFNCTSSLLMMLELTSCDKKKVQNETLKHMANYRISDLPDKWKALRLADLDTTKEAVSYKRVVSKVLDYIDDPSQKGLYLCGNVGVGKSMLSALVCNDFAANGKKVCYINVPEMCQRIKGLFQDDEFDRQIYWMKNADFVVFDDIGAESATAWVRDELLFPIFNHRMENSLPTWFTSNEDFESLFEHYKNCSNIADEMKALRIMERIKSLSEFVRFDGKNRRK